MIILGAILFLSGFAVGYSLHELRTKVPHQGTPCTLSPVVHEEIQDILETEPEIKNYAKRTKSKRKS